SQVFGQNYSKHADQVSFALAMKSLKKKVSHLNIKWNYPTHLEKNLLPNIEPRIIHFHGEIDEHMNLKKRGLKKLDKAIELVNNRTSKELSNHLNNSLF